MNEHSSTKGLNCVIQSMTEFILLRGANLHDVKVSKLDNKYLEVLRYSLVFRRF